LIVGSILNQEHPRWSIERHSRVPKAIKEIVLTMTMIRSIALWSSISLLPNELLFLIFEQLDINAILRASGKKRPPQEREQQQPSRQQSQEGRRRLQQEEPSNEPNRRCHVM